MSRRRAQHAVWRAVAATTIALGLACDVVVWGFWGPLATAVGVFVPGCVMAVLVGKSAWASARIGILIAVVLLSCAGLLAAFGWSGFLLALMVGLTSPLVRIVLLTGRMSAAMRQPPPGDSAAVLDDAVSLDGLGLVGTTGGSLTTLVPLAEIPDASGVPRLDDDALCQAWRRSYVRLEVSRAADARLEVVRLRQLYLDELVRRHPAEVQHWLESGARAAGNPLPFLERPVLQDGPSEDEHNRGSDAG